MCPPRALHVTTRRDPHATPHRDAQVTGWLEREVADPKQRVALVVQTLLHAGSKSVSHLEKLLDKFGWLLQARARLWGGMDGARRARLWGGTDGARRARLWG
eukprot:3710026-Prymnesium_polylepis.1